MLRTISSGRLGKRSMRRPPRRNETAIHAQQRGSLRFGQLAVSQNRRLGLAHRLLGLDVARLEQTGPIEQRPEWDAQSRRDRPQDREGRLMQAALQLAEVGI